MHFDQRPPLPQIKLTDLPNRREPNPRVVVPLDGSELAERALGVAEALAVILTAPIHLLHVVDPAIPPATRRDEAKQYLTDVATRFPHDLPVEMQVLEGDPVEELLHWLNGAERTIVAMSTHGRRGIPRVLFGSVADKVIRSAHVPVAVVRSARAQSRDIQHVLVPLDGSTLSASALPVAAMLAHPHRTIGLVRVVDDTRLRAGAALAYALTWSDPELRADGAAHAKEAARSDLVITAARLRNDGYRVSWEVRTGRPSDEIIRTAETTGADLIVMATHGWEGVRRWTFGSVTDEVVRRSQVPVVVVPSNNRFA